MWLMWVVSTSPVRSPWSVVQVCEAVATIDPIRQAALAKVAIVSLRERQAQEAVGLLRERCNAQIILVSETHPAPVTRFVNLNNFLAEMGILERTEQGGDINWSNSLAYFAGHGQLWVNLLDVMRRARCIHRVNTRKSASRSSGLCRTGCGTMVCP